MKILDATCGAKNMWFNPNHPLVTYIDRREGKFVSWDKKNASRRITEVSPDIVADWTKRLPFDDESFDMVLFDPPHRIQTKEYSVHMDKKYGFLNKDTWRQELSVGIIELFRVLKPAGVFVFKWGQRDVSIDEIIKLFPYPPIFGNKTANVSVNDKDTIWIVFLKYNVNHTLEG